MLLYAISTGEAQFFHFSFEEAEAQRDGVIYLPKASQWSTQVCLNLCSPGAMSGDILGCRI